jgi:serralysin
MYINSQGLELKTTSSGNQNIGGTVGGIRTGAASNDIFNGVKNEFLYGGQGNDAYNLWDSSARIVENAGEGVETVYVKFWGGYQLPENVENVFLQSGGANWATGNRLDNLLVAGTLHATLDGGAGNDVLVGGAGADVFKITVGNGSDVIYNFRAGWDVVKLTGYGFTSFDQLKTAASQTGADVVFKLTATETLTLRDVQLGALSAADFGLAMAKAAAPAGSLQYGAGRGYNANGWYVATNGWGSSGLVEGKDYSLNAVFKPTDMTKGTTFTWSYALSTDVTPTIRAFPEVIFGVSPMNSTGRNPTDTKMVLPAKVGDLTSLTATYDVSYAGNAGGFNVAYDIWLTSKAYGDRSTVTNEVMVWIHNGDFPAHGTMVGTYVSGDVTFKIYHSGTYTALVADKDVPKGVLDIAGILKTLQAFGYVSSSDYVASIELGAEVVSGAGSLTINDLNLRVATKSATGGEIVKTVTGAATTVTETTALAAPAALKAASLAASYQTGVTKLLDAQGQAIGSQTTIVAADKVTITNTGLTGASLGYDVARLETDGIRVQHFDGAGKAAGSDKVVYGMDGRVMTHHYSNAGAYLGADKSFTEAGGVKVVQHLDAKGALAGFAKTSTDALGVVITKFYNAASMMTGLDKVTPKTDGSVLVQHFDGQIKLLSMDAIKATATGSMVYHYDSAAKLVGVETVTLDAKGVETSVNYDASNKLVDVTYLGTDRADVLTGSANVTHFHGGLGSDQLTAGVGVDLFHFDTPIGQGDVDTIVGFKTGQDKIVLDGKIFGLAVGALDAGAFVVGAKALDATDRVIFNSATGQLWFDDDGRGAHAPILIGQISAEATLTAANFLVS